MTESSAKGPTDRVVELKNPLLAAGLALLIPGLGHLYQGRHFKAAIYCVCILGLFFTGQALGEWKVVYLANGESSGRIDVPRRVEIVGRLFQGYIAQFPAGVAAWPAIVQSRRYADPENTDERVALDEPLTADFEGGIRIQTAHSGPIELAALEGTLSLERQGRAVVGTFKGTTSTGQEVSLTLRRVDELGKKIAPDEWRLVKADLAAMPEWIEFPPDETIPSDAEAYFQGGIARPVRDWYQVPLGSDGEGQLIADLGTTAEIAWVFTWVAGLLNVLAIWDAFDGPAYGFGLARSERRKRGRLEDDDNKDDDPAPRKAPAEPASPTVG